MQKDALGALVSLEMGKIRTEGEGEVQEFVDIVSPAHTSQKRTLNEAKGRLCGWIVPYDERPSSRV